MSCCLDIFLSYSFLVLETKSSTLRLTILWSYFLVISIVCLYFLLVYILIWVSLYIGSVLICIYILFVKCSSQIVFFLFTVQLFYNSGSSGALLNNFFPRENCFSSRNLFLIVLRIEGLNIQADLYLFFVFLCRAQLLSRGTYLFISYFNEWQKSWLPYAKCLDPLTHIHYHAGGAIFLPLPQFLRYGSFPGVRRDLN